MAGSPPGEHMEFGPKHGTFALRIALGLLFIIPGIGKLMDPSGTAQFFTGLGIPLASVAVWLVIAVEVLGGLALLIGWQTKWAVFPLGIVMLIAIFTVVIPNMGGNPVNLLFHILTVAGLKSLYFTGPGAWAVQGE